MPCKRLSEKWLLVPRCLLVPGLDLSKAIWEFVDEEGGPPVNIFLAGVPKPDVVSFAVGLVEQVKFFQIQRADLFADVENGIVLRRLPQRRNYTVLDRASFFLLGRVQQISNATATNGFASDDRFGTELEFNSELRPSIAVPTPPVCLTPNAFI
jgi:hypothetical protein